MHRHRADQQVVAMTEKKNDYVQKTEAYRPAVRRVQCIIDVNEP